MSEDDKGWGHRSGDLKSRYIPEESHVGADSSHC